MRRKDREISDIEELESILERAEVCYVALCDGDSPYLVSLNFGYDNSSHKKLYFHCAKQGKKIDIIKNNNKAYFQIDTDHKLVVAEDACDFSMKYSSVAGTGKIYMVESEEERQRGLNILMRQYSGKDNFEFKPAVMKNTLILCLDIESITGKQVQ